MSRKRLNDEVVDLCSRYVLVSLLQMRILVCSVWFQESPRQLQLRIKTFSIVGELSAASSSRKFEK